MFTWLHVSEYRNFWNTEEGSLQNNGFSFKQLFQTQKPLPKWRQRFVKYGEAFFVKKLKIFKFKFKK